MTALFLSATSLLALGEGFWKWFHRFMSSFAQLIIIIVGISSADTGTRTTSDHTPPYEHAVAAAHEKPTSAQVASRLLLPSG